MRKSLVLNSGSEGAKQLFTVSQVILYLSGVGVVLVFTLGVVGRMNIIVLPMYIGALTASAYINCTLFKVISDAVQDLHDTKRVVIELLNEQSALYERLQLHEIPEKINPANLSEDALKSCGIEIAHSPQHDGKDALLLEGSDAHHWKCSRCGTEQRDNRSVCLACGVVFANKNF